MLFSLSAERKYKQIINYTVSNLQLLTSVEVNMHFYRPKTIYTDLHKAEINMVSLQADKTVYYKSL